MASVNEMRIDVVAPTTPPATPSATPSSAFESSSSDDIFVSPSERGRPATIVRAADVAPAEVSRSPTLRRGHHVPTQQSPHRPRYRRLPTGRTFGKNALLSKLEVLFRRLKIHAAGLTMRQITNAFYDSIQGKSATAYYVLDPHFDTDADAPVKPHVEPSLAQRVSTIRPWNLAVYAVWFAANGPVRGRGGKVSEKNLGNGFIIAKASASLIWLNLPLTLVLLCSDHALQDPLRGGWSLLAAGIAHTVGHMIFGRARTRTPPR